MMKKEYTQRTARLIGQDKVDELDTKKVLIFGVRFSMRRLFDCSERMEMTE